MTTTALARVAERVAPLAPRKPRRAGPRDKLRVVEFARRLAEGEDELTAGWRTLSDPKNGIARWRGAAPSARPSDVTIVRKLASLLRRTLPELIEQARDVTLSRIVGLSDKAMRALDEVTSGDFTDPVAARVQLDGAKVVFEALGIGPRAAAAATVATQVNVSPVMSFGDVIRAARCIDEEAVDVAAGKAP